MTIMLLSAFKEGSPEWLFVRGVYLGREIETKVYNGIDKEDFAEKRMLDILDLYHKGEAA